MYLVSFLRGLCLGNFLNLLELLFIYEKPPIVVSHLPVSDRDTPGLRYHQAVKNNISLVLIVAT